MESIDFPRIMQSIVEDIQSRPLAVASGASASATLHREGSLDEARAALDDSISAIERAVADAVKAIRDYKESSLVSLRRHRNSLTPIHRLPCEILSSIFLFVADDYSGVDYPACNYPLTLLRVSYLWRQIALQSPRFWARPHKFLPRALFETFLRRSKNALLDIFFKPQNKRQPMLGIQEYMELVSPHISRWRSCSLQAASKTKVLSRLSASAPSLEVLSLNYGETGNFSRDTDQSKTPLNPFGGYAPRLRELSLGGIFIPFTSPLYSNLSTLRLARIRYSNPDAPEQFMQILGCTPLLETLWLDDLEFSSSSNAPESQLRSELSLISLPRLQSLRMVTVQIDQRWVLRHILSRILAPPSCRLDMSAMLDEDDDLSSIIPEQSNSQHLQNLSNVGSLEISCLSNVIALEGHALEANEDSFSISTHAYNGHVNASSILSSIGKAFPTPCLDTLTLFWSNYEYPEEDPAIAASFADLLMRHPSIKKLVLQSCSELFVQALSEPTSGYPCRRLDTLIINDSPDLTDSTLESIVKDSRDNRQSASSLRIQHSRCPNVTLPSNF
ncbi:hypothetical protein BOTBODRAFT_38483 [Botryobasidium botryosum FD-172 SS1]|uniref:F-box domain-containing protein n=1 Tax=Botryobasidium botryosum (strain FD-172 SS1) TaxID=930990 RepID=A0A067M7H9_BOTB1|nr:hypothetical protein BOTBODRAFT_38483 [Botryobasidium botryosum FD-172 SS1]